MGLGKMGSLGGLYVPDDEGFNEVIGSALIPFSVATSTSSSYTVSNYLQYNSLAELDFVYVDNQGSVGSAILMGTPDGFASRLYSFSTDVIELALSAAGVLTITFGAGTALDGAIRVLRRNRKLKNYALLTAVGAPSPLPFTIANVNRAALSPVGPTANTWRGGSSFVDVYLPNAYFHLSGVQGIRIESPTMYRTKTTTATIAALMEFE